MQLILFAWVASAAEVVWLTPAPDAVAAATVAQQAGAARPPLAPTELRYAGTDATDADEAAIRRVSDALRDAHPYELKLDGELLIMAELERPIAGVSLLRDRTDRDILFAALAYQGFAVDRYYGDALPTDERAAPYRVAFESATVVGPWLDALALDPKHAIGPYDIAEAPQRVRFLQTQDRVAELLPALVVPLDLPPGSELVIDGIPAIPGPSGSVPVTPGRHLAHVARDGHVLARFDLRLAPAEQHELRVPLSDATWDAWIATFARGAPAAPPASLGPSLAALGGSVWVVAPGKDPRRASAWEVTADGVKPLAPVALAPDTGGSGSSAGGASFAVGLGSGWCSTADFYNQDPANVPDTRAAVNAGSVAANASFSGDFGVWRFGVGVDVVYTLGDDHVARYGDAGSTRFRPYPYAAAGIRWVQATAGYVFPHNPGFGARGALPLGRSPVELVAAGLYGVHGDRARPDGSEWRGAPLYEAWGGFDLRFGPGSAR